MTHTSWLDPWLMTAHLALDREGRLWIRATEDEDSPRVDLGPIALAEVEPGLAGELAELLDAWRDTPRRSDLHREWNQEWAAERGL